MSLEGPLTVWLFVCFARLQSLFSAWRPTEQEIELLKAVHLQTLSTDQSQSRSDKSVSNRQRVPLPSFCNQ